MRLNFEKNTKQHSLETFKNAKQHLAELLETKLAFSVPEEWFSLLSHCLCVQVSEVDVSGLHLLEVRSSGSDFLVYQKDWFPSFVFSHLREERSVRQFFFVCQLLGKQGDLPLLVDHFLHQFSLAHTSRGPEVLLVLLKVLEGAAMCGGAAGMASDDVDTSPVRHVLEEMTDYSRPVLTEIPVKQRCHLVCLHSLRLLVLEQCALLLGKGEGGGEGKSEKRRRLIKK